MSKYRLNLIQSSECDKWDNFVENSDNGTIFHKLKFLRYHESEKYKDKFHNLCLYKGDSIVGIIPLGLEDYEGGLLASSPFGASYGGFVFGSKIEYRRSREIVLSFLKYMKNLNVKKIVITPTINEFCYKPCDTFIFSMLEAGFKLVNSDITNVVNLKNETNIESQYTSRARNAIRKALNLGVRVVRNGSLDDFWSLMSMTFERHGKSPTHKKSEFELLGNYFPRNVYCDIAYYDGVPVAGIGYININNKTYSSFYLCTNINYSQTQALSLLVSDALIEAKKCGAEIFDFGTSSLNMVARENIFLFKESFGAVGRFRNTYMIDL